MLVIAVALESENPDDSREGNYGEFRQFVSIAACLWRVRKAATDSIDSRISKKGEAIQRLRRALDRFVAFHAG